MPLLPLSRQGADASFRKLAVEAALVQPVGAGVQIAINARAQTAFGKPLVNAEQNGIAAVDGLSPLPSRRLQGDMGYVEWPSGAEGQSVSDRVEMGGGRNIKKK